MKLFPILVLKFKKNSNQLVSIIDLMNDIKDGSSLYWTIQHMELLGNLMDTPYKDYAPNAWEFNACIPISWETMYEIAPKIDWVIWMDLIGFKSPELVKIYNSDFELLKNCWIGIFRLDGEYWEIFTQDTKLYDILQSKYEIVKFIVPEDFFRPY